MERFKLSYTRTRRQKIIMTLAAFIVFVTTYALILPAITIDTDTAEKEPGMEFAADESAMPALSLQEEVGDITVSVEAEAGVFPVNTSMVVTEQESEVLLPMLEATAESKVERCDAINIAFEDENGDPVEPQNPYSVKMVSDSITGSVDRLVMQVAGDVVSVVDDPEFSYKQVEFSADATATFAIVETSELTSEYLSADGNLYEVTVTYDYTAQIPEDARLEITEFNKNSDVYEASRRAFLGALETGEEEENQGEELFMDILDLTIRREDESVVEPAAPVQVSIKRKNLPEDFDSSEGGLLVQHLNESGDDPFVETMDSAVLVSADTLTASFQTSSFSTYSLRWRSGGRTVTVHYGYMEGNTFQEFGNGIPAHTPDFNSTNNYTTTNAFLIQDIDGYKYSSTHLNRATGTQISSLLNYSNREWRYTTNITSTNSPSWTNLSSGNHIYVIYEPDNSTPTQGGTPTLYESDIVIPDNPTMHKDSTNNYDGTRTISLSIDGHANPVLVEKLADVIVIFDVSGSMNDDMEGNSTNDDAERRINLGKEAIQDLADELLGPNYINKEGNPQIRMALVTFSNTAEEKPFSILPDGLLDSSGKPMNQSDDEIIKDGEQWQPYPDLNFTSNPEKIGALLDTVSAEGGTNWEQALKIANEMPVDPERETIIIFVSDGNPTFRITRDVPDPETGVVSSYATDASLADDSSPDWYRVYDVFGKGNDDPTGDNYDAALIQAKSIVQQGKQLYGIGIGNVSKMERLTDDAGAGAGHSFAASDKDELRQAFADIKASIAGYIGWSDVSVTDGITGMTNLVAKSNLAGMSVGTNDADITYTKIIKDENGNVIDTIDNWDPTAETPVPCGTACFNAETGALEWDMGENFQLKDNTTYVVNFKVWPNQEAIDIVTRLNNKEVTFDELTPEEKAQIAPQTGTDPVTGEEYTIYTLRTNTDAGMSYTPTRSSSSGSSSIPLGPEVTVACTDPVDPLVMQTMPLRVQKQFEDSFGDETGDGVGADRPEEVVLYLQRREIGDPNAQWENVNLFRQPDGTYSNKIVLNADNGWQTDEFYVAPGLVDADGITRELGHEYRVLEEALDYHYELDPEEINPLMYGYDDFKERDYDPALLALREVYVVKEYNGDIDQSTDLTAINVVKGGINLFKKVVDSSGNAVTGNTETFTIRGWILDPDGNPYTFDPALDDRTDKSKKATADTPLFAAHQNDPIPYHFYDANNNRVIYKGHFADTSNIEFTIKHGEQIRFPIIPIGSTFSFWEVDGDGMPTGYVLDSAVGVAQENLLNPITGKYEFANSEDTNKYPTTDANDHINGIIYGNTLDVLEFKNRIIDPGTITVKKIVTKTDEQTEIWPEDSFAFTGFIRYRSGGWWNPQYSGRALQYTIYDRNGEEVGHGTFQSTYNNQSGESTINFTLKAGEYIEIQGVQNNDQYGFQETALANNSDYSFVSVTGSAVSATGATVQNPPTLANNNNRRMDGTMHSNEEHDLLFKNKVKKDPVDVQLLKMDFFDEDLRLNGVTFELYTDAAHTTHATDFSGAEIGTITTGGYADFNQQIPLGYAKIGNLSPGTYYLVETGVPPGYLAPSGDIIITIDNNGNTSVYNPDFASETGSEAIEPVNGVIVIRVPNLTEATGPLPNTGGIGTNLFYISGGLLIFAAALIYIFSFRRRKGGKRRPEFP